MGKNRLTGVSLVALTALLALGAGEHAYPQTPPTPQTPQRSVLFGYDATRAADEQALERQFDAQLDPMQLRSVLQQMSSQPNQVGSAHDKANAMFMLQQLRDWGWDAQLETFSVLYPTPRRVAVELLAPSRQRLLLHESYVSGDRSSAIGAGALPPYNVYGADGDVTGELVYVNYGLREDYQELERRGISVQGKIVIARYGGGWRGLKPKLAHEHGAIGCLIYSDPHEDGYAAGDVYPQGGWRPPNGVQRGSVADITQYSGDPLTPGVGATPDARRLALADVKTLMKIPVLPISYADAQPLLAALHGPVAPPAWRGSLGITYHMGAGPAKVHLHVESDWGMKTIYDVVARIAGRELPDEWVIRGNHHDGWVFGAWDPLSGNNSLLAEARAIGALLKTGWRPRRTLIYCSWDAEEPGLLGSTEWAETHAAQLADHAVLYVNSDESARGFLNMGGSFSMQHVVNEVAGSVSDPETSQSVLARKRARIRVDAYDGASDAARRLASSIASGGDVPLTALGTGSDYSPFLQHLGVASVDLGFSGEADQAGVYHSQYDTFEHYERFGDPGFHYGIALAQTAGHLVLRVADADVLPMQFGAVADAIEGFLHELHQLADERRDHAQRLSELLQAHAFELVSDPTRPVGPPVAEAEVPFLDFSPLDNAVARLKRATRAYDDVYGVRGAGGFDLDHARTSQLDMQLLGLERALTSEQGLPGRPWYRHLIYAPGVYTGYGAKTLPGVREAIEERRWEVCAQYIHITAQAIDNFSDKLEAAAAMLRN
ncbi:MAG TPA: transferrin receptor-like dimerization domain-containing protein [Steroidobacteraceae bacterium]|jgi:N-acetylated-alpha-linked acidic dipeptidase|nr:transferrin receptor-like dimerization domain-containing protein [Steroidobacteraceae bacterium]